jgi:hypothetical protein
MAIVIRPSFPSRNRGCTGSRGRVADRRDPEDHVVRYHARSFESLRALRESPPVPRGHTANLYLGTIAHDEYPPLALSKKFK